MWDKEKLCQDEQQTLKEVEELIKEKANKQGEMIKAYENATQ